MTESVAGTTNQTEAESSTDYSKSPLMRIEPICHSRLRWFLLLLPCAMLVAVPIIAWPSNPLGIPGQFIFSTGFIAATLALFTFQVLMQRISEIFEVLWRRGVIANSAQPSNNLAPSHGVPGQHLNDAQRTVLYEKYRSFVKKTEGTLNSKGQWITATIFMALVLSWFLYGFSFQFVKEPILIVGILAELIIATVIGLMAWRMIVIGMRVWRLPQRFDLEIQSGHPDRCGGLEPLGNLCLWNALIIAMAGIFLGGWIAIGPNTPDSNLAIFYAPIFRPLLTIPITLSFVSFFIPLWSTHRVMVAKKNEIESQLDELAQIIYRENRELLNSADRLDPAEGENRLKKMELMREIYSQNQRIPAWPINVAILSKFLASQAIPVLSFLGVAEPIVSMVTGLLQNISQ
ncbi:MAG: hypothetical protein KAR65_01290 [Anaerolineales bacterium]|nr:hypothetical protein [Anaerolineales bacterium]